jgi:hypothetical protein
MAKNEGDPFFLAQIGQPVPGEDAFRCNNDVLTVGGDHLKKDTSVGPDITVFPDLSLLIKDTDVHFSCM